MGKSSSKKRSRGADEDDVDSSVPEVPAPAPAVKKSKIDENGKAEVTKNGVEETRLKKDKKEKKDKKKENADKSDKKEKKDKRDRDTPAEAEDEAKEDPPKKEKKEKKDKKKKKSKSKDSGIANNDEDIAMEDAGASETTAVNGNGAEAGSDKKNSKKDKKDKKDNKLTKKSSSAENQQDEAESDQVEAAHEDTNQGSPSSKPSRFICFVGNLPYTATADAVRTHFASIQPTSVRLLTHKDDPSRSRGTAFVEFGRYDYMKTCLEKFHDTEFNDGISPARKINVELTAGGGGKTPHRLEKIKAKNQKLNEERAQRMAKGEAAKFEKAVEKDKDQPKDQQAQQPEQNEAGWIHPSRLGRVPHEQQTQEQRDQDPNHNEQPAWKWDGTGGKFRNKRFESRSRGGGGGGGRGRGGGRGSRGKFRGGSR